VLQVSGSVNLQNARGFAMWMIIVGHWTIVAGHTLKLVGKGHHLEVCSYGGVLDSCLIYNFSDYSNEGGPIRFYNKYEAFYEFTNFYEFAPFHLDGKEWRSTEHYFQAQKFIGTPYVEYIRLYGGPRDAFQTARDPEVLKWRRSDWDAVKLDVMYKALLAKFTGHERLRQLLLSTGNRRLVEHTFNDSFWGDGGTGTGQNHLGELLVKVRGLINSKRTISIT
jgi:ribA/ribD-fused uncharacterized protein